MRTALGALLVCLTLAAVHTWPISWAPRTTSLNSNADAELNEWTLSWIAHTLPTHPTRLFDGDIFAPEPDTLAYTDPLIVPALVGAPVYWLGGSPVFAFNVSLIVGLALTAWAGWFVVWRWTGSAGGALVSGALTAFNVHLLTRLPHVQAAHSWGLPLGLYLADRVLTRATRRDVVWLAVVVAATAATSLYTLAFLGLAIAIMAVVNLPAWRGVTATGAACLLGLAIAAPILWPYVRLEAGGTTRPLSMVAQFSASPAAYLTSLSRLDARWTRPFFRDDVNVLFAGGVALSLAVLGASVLARDRARRRLFVALTLIAVAGILLSFGPTTALYRTLYAWLPPLRGLRAVARFGYLYLVVVAVFAGFGVATLERLARTTAGGGVVVAIALAAVTVEAWTAVPATRFDGVPAIYDVVRRAPGPVLLVEVPFYPAEAIFENGEYVLNATAHWRPVANGTSGLVPDSYRRRADVFWFFPRDEAIDAIERDGATHLMVHLERFTPPEVTDIEDSLRHRPELQLIASDARGHRLYRIDRGAVRP